MWTRSEIAGRGNFIFINPAAIIAWLLLFPVTWADETRVNLSGFYMPASNLNIEAATEFIHSLPEDAVLLADAGFREFGPMEFGGLKLKPHALEQAERWSPQEELKPENTCRLPSIIYSMQGPFPIEIDQGRDILVLRLEYFDLVRVIYLDGRKHLPQDVEHSVTGNSIGHWEHDILVVDTTHLREGTITNNGLNHSENVHLMERFRLSPDGNQLWMTQLFEDPDTLENRGARFMAWNRVPAQHVLPYECNPFTYLE